LPPAPDLRVVDRTRQEFSVNHDAVADGRGTRGGALEVIRSVEGRL